MTQRQCDADRIAYLELSVLRLQTSLGHFVADPRFQVAVGGNPNVVEKMIEEARAAYDFSIFG